MTRRTPRNFVMGACAVEIRGRTWRRRVAALHFLVLHVPLIAFFRKLFFGLPFLLMSALLLLERFSVAPHRDLHEFRGGRWLK